ncbi:hypothetical protein N2597_08210 [Rhizobium sophoriradicis]|uniref:hypothetical protein n=1 Tax=Rhizobium sophoriradicis TaxID=1535245 RepID=UPI0016151BB5|nr:hypothetical protein N2597_08210 [Rhizobium leguminosarum bv. phaseoli]
MLSLASLRPSQFKALEIELGNKLPLEEFVDAVCRFLATIPADGGADSDFIFMTARKLTSAQVWKKVPAASLGAALRSVPTEALKVFAEGLPPNYAEKVLTSAAKEELEKKAAQGGFSVLSHGVRVGKISSALAGTGVKVTGVRTARGADVAAALAGLYRGETMKPQSRAVAGKPSAKQKTKDEDENRRA